MLDYEILPAALSDLLARTPPGTEGAPLLLDVREPGEYQISRIPGSLLMPMGEVSSRAFQEIDPDEHIVTICHHGVRSMNVAVWLRNQGFEHAQSLRGGIDAWAREIDTTLPRY